jgi:O-antigen/teichoic acid export membrane protein
MEKWLPAVPFLQIYYITFAFYPIVGIILNVISASGKSGSYLLVGIINKVIGIIALIISVFYKDVLAIALGEMLVYIFCIFIILFYINKIFNYTVMEFFHDVIPYVLMALTMAVIVYFAGKLISNNLFSLLFQVFLGVNIYLVASIVFKVDSLSM